MSYFSHSFRKSFVGTKPTQALVLPPAVGAQKAVNNGLLITSGLGTEVLGDAAAPNGLGVGTYGFFDPKTYKSVVVADAQVQDGRPLILAASALMQNDKIGPFHGGYKESNKSKKINPRYISKWSKMTAAAPEQAVSHIGNTNMNLNGAATFTITNAGAGYTSGTYTDIVLSGGSGTSVLADITVAGGVITVCTLGSACGQGYVVGDTLTPVDLGTAVPTTAAIITVATLKYDENARCTAVDFICGETYNLRVDLWGSPVLRFLNHDLYKTFAAYTGCCPTGTVVPGNVDSTLVMINWANQIVDDVWAQYFIKPIVYSEAGVPLFHTAADAIAAGYPGTQLWSSYVSTGHTAGAMAGIRIAGAYVDTTFGNCSFQTSDFFQKEIVQMNLSLTDLTGDPCEFSALCTFEESAGFVGQGFGETVLRDVILDESYLQNHFANNDTRIREITQGDDFFSAVPRNAFYTRYVLQHSVPRFNNPSGVFDNDQYTLNIYTTAATATALETLVQTWVDAALGTDVVELETYGHTAITLEAI